jgi:hypothetical protein
MINELQTLEGFQIGSNQPQHKFANLMQTKYGPGWNIVNQQRVGNRNPYLPMERGAFCSIPIKYLFGNEGRTAITNWAREQVGQYDLARKLRIDSGYVPHEHPVGATMRDIFSMLVYQWCSGRTKFEIGASRKRIVQREDSNGLPIAHTLHSANPELDVRDTIRLREMSPSELNGVSSCKCTCGRRTRMECEFCQFNFERNISIDSCYYDGVIDELHIRGQFGGIGYVVFNDYHKAYLTRGRNGRCLDGESNYSIYEEKGELMVRSKVEGNPAAYNHKIVNTSGLKTWQYKLPVDPLLSHDGFQSHYWAIWNIEKEFWNGDVPYRIAKVHVIPQSKEDSPKEGMAGVPVLDDIFAKATSKEFGASEDTDLTDSDEPSILTRPEEVEPNPAPLQMLLDKVDKQLGLDKIKNQLKEGQEILDFRNNEIRNQSKWENFKHLIEATAAWSNERIFVTERLEMGVKRAEVNLMVSDKCWWTLGLPLKNTTYKAPLWAVEKAYTEIGCKVTDASIQYVKVRLQQADPTNAFAYRDAISIARVMRSMERERETTLAQTSVAISTQK